MICPAEIRAAAETLRLHRKALRKARPERVQPTAKGQREVRQTDKAFLAYLRRQPCEALHMGDCNGPIQAAHIRMSIPGRPNPGMQRKPDDQFAVSLCAHHHLHDQHAGSERAFWSRVGKDPFATAAKHYAAFQAGAR